MPVAQTRKTKELKTRVDHGDWHKVTTPCMIRVHTLQTKKLRSFKGLAHFGCSRHLGWLPHQIAQQGPGKRDPGQAGTVRLKVYSPPLSK